MEVLTVFIISLSVTIEDKSSALLALLSNILRGSIKWVITVISAKKPLDCIILVFENVISADKPFLKVLRIF